MVLDEILELSGYFPGATVPARRGPAMVHRTRILEGSGGHLKRLAACLWHGAADHGVPGLGGTVLVCQFAYAGPAGHAVLSSHSVHRFYCLPILRTYLPPPCENSSKSFPHQQKTPPPWIPPYATLLGCSSKFVSVIF